MPNTFTESVFSSTYKDDFKDSDNFHRVLFNSGRALQARELTQLQTIIQEEIGRFGRNIFKEGASVNPGGPTITSDYEFIKITSTNIPTDTSTLIGATITQSGGTNNSIQAKILQFVGAENSDPDTLYVQYINTSGAGQSTTNPIRFNAGATLTGPASGNLTIQSVNTTENPAVGQGCLIANSAGDFFTRGHFVFAKAQKILLSKYTRFPTKVVGFKVTEDVITSADNTALFDNQGSVPNLSSPGADRYRIQLTLTTKDLIANDENFVYYCDVVDGNIVDQVKGTDDYNKINELLAQRTFDESGNYIVKNFDADYTDSGTNLIASIGDGVAYINGYRGATEKPTKLTIPKPRTTITNTNENVGINYGQYISVEGGADISGDLSDATFEELVLVDSTGTNAKLGGTGNGGKIGTARLRYLEEDGTDHKAYLFDIEMDGGKSFRNTKMIARSGETNQFAKVVLENSKCVLKESQKVNLIYPTPNPRPKSVTDVDFEVQRVFTNLSPTGGKLTLSLSVTGEAFTSKDTWIVIRGDGTSGATVVSPTITLGSGNTSVEISGGTPALSGSTGTYAVYAKVQKSSPTLITKTLTTVEAGITSSGTEVNLHRTDLFDVEYIRQDSANGTDVSNLFTIDNGQRAGFYDNARLMLNAGSTMPSTTFYKFRHFVHGNGDYMSVNSYTGQVNYEDIPGFVTPRKAEVNLRDVIDFRPVVDSSGNFSGTRAIAIEPPTSSDIFQADIEYYQPRSDKIVVTTDGVIKHIQGQDGFGSQVPDTPENTLALYNLELNAYGLNDSDLVSTPVRAKRFRMQDIETLENRVDKLEEVTSLSLLENSTDSLLVLDGSGNIRTKSGFFVDNFADRNFSDTTNSEYRAGIDPSRGILQPATFEDNIGLVYDSDKSSNTILKGDTIYLKHTEVQAIAQELVSGVENVNPFAVITGEGNITLSPSTDEWTQTKYAPANVINRTAEETLPDLNEGNLALGTARNRGLGQWAWSGFTFIPLLGFGFEPEINIFGGWANWITWNNNGVTPTNTNRVGNNIVRQFSQRVVVGSRTVRKLVGDKSVSLTFLPFIRSRKVFFKAEGLRPNTRYFPFFDGKAVDNFVRTETFQRASTASSGNLAYGNKFRNSSEHPQTKSTLTSDTSGEIAGSFFIPSSTTNRFRAGTREFKLLDVSVDNGSELSSASVNYVAQGTLDTRQETITSTRITQVRTRRWTETQRVRRRDPLAQSFAVTTGGGMFVTAVECFFASKDTSGVPVELQIRPMVNGSPSATDIIGNAIKFLAPGSVTTTAISGATQSTVVANPTKFTFDEPVFLNPDTEYAIVLLAESIEYEAYVAETYAFELGSTEKRISRQPSMGSLFKSQNGTTWEPDQTKDLMFRIYRADFDTNGGFACFENASVEADTLENNGLFIDNSTNTLTVLMPNHGYDVGDTVKIEQLDSENYPTFGLAGNTLTGDSGGKRAITAADGFGFQITQTGASSSGRFGGRNIAIDRQIHFDLAIPQFTTLIPEDTTINYGAKFTTGTSLAKVTGNQVRYQKDGNYSSDVFVNEENRFTAPRLIAKDSNETLNLGSGVKSTTFKIDMTTARANVSPVIDAQRASLSTQSNQIDKQSNSAASGLNVPLNYQAETSAFGGSTLAKHMTTVQTLEETAIGLKIIVSCMRPSESNFRLFFRTAASDENLIDKAFVEQSPEQTIAPDAENFREYRFLAGGNSGSLDDFTQYQVKIVMESTNTSRIPIFKDLRVIAMAT
ncbi:MAG: hypothetical protein CMO97_06145 [Woeseia sp.]|nr:hypothetical protein [Woeseia sp.]